MHDTPSLKGKVEEGKGRGVIVIDRQVERSSLAHSHWMLLRLVRIRTFEMIGILFSDRVMHQLDCKCRGYVIRYLWTADRLLHTSVTENESVTRLSVERR